MDSPKEERTPRKREHIPCDEVKPASARKPHIQKLDFEPPTQEGPAWVKHPVRSYRYSPRKAPTQSRAARVEEVALDRAWRKKTRREDPEEYEATKRLCAATPGCPPLSSPSHSSEEEDRPRSTIKRSRAWLERQEALKQHQETAKVIRTPFTRWDQGCWDYMRLKPGAVLPRCEFKAW